MILFIRMRSFQRAAAGLFRAAEQAAEDLVPAALRRRPCPSAMTTISSAISRMRRWCEMISSEPSVSLQQVAGTHRSASGSSTGRCRPRARRTRYSRARAREHSGDLDALALAAGQAGAHLAVNVLPGAQADAGTAWRTARPRPSVSPAASSIRSRTVSPLKRTGC